MSFDPTDIKQLASAYHEQTRELASERERADEWQEQARQMEAAWNSARAERDETVAKEREALLSARAEWAAEREAHEKTREELRQHRGVLAHAEKLHDALRARVARLESALRGVAEGGLGRSLDTYRELARAVLADTEKEGMP